MALCEVALSDGSDLLAEEMKFGLGWNSTSTTLFIQPFCYMYHLLFVFNPRHRFKVAILIDIVSRWNLTLGMPCQKSVFDDFIATYSWKLFDQPLIIQFFLSNLKLNSRSFLETKVEFFLLFLDQYFYMKLFTSFIRQSTSKGGSIGST